MNTSLANTLRLRFQYEEIVKSKNFILPDYEGTINSLEWFIEHGHKRNKRNNLFLQALEIANTIVGTEYEHRKK